ncbi:MAG: acyltransferase family protein [Asticcacaulis sp.]
MSPSATPRPRLQSLDSLRGLVVLGMILVNSAAYLFYAAQKPIWPWLLHAHWQGFLPADWVFPAFVLMVGLSIGYVMPDYQAGGRLTPAGLGRHANRAVRLLLIGLVLSNLYWLADPSAHVARLPGVLQRLALVFFAVVVVHLTLGRRTHIGVILALLLGYWGILSLPLRGGIATDLSVPGQNWQGLIDRLVFGPYIFVKGPLGYDPEGLLSTLPAIAQGLIGALIGTRLREQPATLAQSRSLALLGTAILIGGLIWGLIHPISKDLWTGSYVALTTGLTLLVLALFHALEDARGEPSGLGLPQPLANLLKAFGINALFAYVLHYLASILLLAKAWDFLFVPLSGVITPEGASFVIVLAFIGLNAWVMLFLKSKSCQIKL